MKNLFLPSLLLTALLTAGAAKSNAQTALYPQLFPLTDVRLNEGPLLRAMQLNDSVLLAYDAGRLMQPYEHEAGIEESGKAFANWTGLDGHVGGHYISALSIAWASCQEPSTKERLAERLSWCLNRIDKAQQAWEHSADTLMHGYVGGVPRSREFFTRFASGEVDVVWKWWVPFYNIHKLFAGLRDAWLYADRQDARRMFLRLCDWGVALVQHLTDEQIEQSLQQEYGGMNEMFADAYAMTGDAKYLQEARRFSHKWLLQGMAKHQSATLDNRHANTQVPKVIGFERVYQQHAQASAQGDEVYGDAARFFWQDVATQRTIAVGGNSINEWFPAATKYHRFITSAEGVESCNSYNMLKLSECLFMDEHHSRYTDFYESTMLNHILSTQHPVTGGYVYFTPARPQHYRVYSQTNQAMWCCVGSGMENHGKYGEFIYSRSVDNDTLWVNLFAASTLQWKARRVEIEQSTTFPYQPASRLTVRGKGTFTMMVRIPSWTHGGFSLRVNGKPVAYTEHKGYAAVHRKWKKGDVVEVSLPMSIQIEPLPHAHDYVAVKYGPLLLCAKTGTEDLKGLHADDSRMGHIASGKQMNIYAAPVLLGDREALKKAIQPINPGKLTFGFGSYQVANAEGKQLVLQPFNTLHDSRYMMYWLNVSPQKWQQIQAALKHQEDSVQAIQARTIDYVQPGRQQSEADHTMLQEKTRQGAAHDERFRQANKGWFEYTMSVSEKTASCLLMVKYWAADRGNATISIDGTPVLVVDDQRDEDRFVNAQCEIPAALLQHKQHVKVRVTSSGRSLPVYELRIVKGAKEL